MIGRQNHMFNKLMGASKRPTRLATRNFSTAIAPTTAAAEPWKTQTESGVRVQTLWDYSDKIVQKNADKVAGEAEYFDTLKTYSTVPGAYNKLSETGSSEHLKHIR